MTSALDILRRASTDYGTPGTATLDNGWQCDTLELPWRGNQKGVSCIKAGSYKAWLWYSPDMHRWVFRLEDKNGRADCLIHTGNWAGDASKGLFTQVHGCTLAGKGFLAMSPPTGGKQQFAITTSKLTLDALIRQVGGDPDLPADQAQPEGTDLLVTYQWADGAWPADDLPASALT